MKQTEKKLRELDRGSVIVKTLEYLLHRCDRVEPDKKDPYDDEMVFVLGKAGRRRIELRFWQSGHNALWFALTVGKDTLRKKSAPEVNLLRLVRQVEEILTEIYRYAWLQGENDFKACTSVEGADGYGQVRERLYDRAFARWNLEWQNDDGTIEDMPGVYKFVPLMLVDDMPGNNLDLDEPCKEPLPDAA